MTFLSCLNRLSTCFSHLESTTRNSAGEASIMEKRRYETLLSEAAWLCRTGPRRPPHFTKDGISEILNLQPKKHHAKAYQVKQVRNAGRFPNLVAFALRMIASCQRSAHRWQLASRGPGGTLLPDLLVQMAVFAASLAEADDEPPQPRRDLLHSGSRSSRAVAGDIERSMSTEEASPQWRRRDSSICGFHCEGPFGCRRAPASGRFLAVRVPSLLKIGSSVSTTLHAPNPGCRVSRLPSREMKPYLRARRQRARAPADLPPPATRPLQ